MALLPKGARPQPRAAPVMRVRVTGGWGVLHQGYCSVASAVLRLLEHPSPSTPMLGRSLLIFPRPLDITTARRSSC